MLLMKKKRRKRKRKRLLLSPAVAGPRGAPQLLSAMRSLLMKRAAVMTGPTSRPRRRRAAQRVETPPRPTQALSPTLRAVTRIATMTLAFPHVVLTDPRPVELMVPSASVLLPAASSWGVLELDSYSG
jgi:hypothetical protein